MKNHGFKAEEYPIVIQVLSKGGIQYLSGFQPDFNYRVIEPYRANDVGQTEMMIIKIRREIASLAARTPSPTPSKSANLFKIPERGHLTTKDAARILNVSDMTVRRLADEGRLKCSYTPNGHRRFSENSLNDFLLNLSSSNENPSPTPPESALRLPDSNV